MSRISSLRACAASSSARSRAHSATNAFFAPRLQQPRRPSPPASSADLVAQPIARQPDQHVLAACRAVHRAQRLQARRALLELGRFGLDALEHQAHLGAALAAQAAQLEHLLGELAAAGRPGGARHGSRSAARRRDDLLEHLAALRQQLRAQRRFERRQPARRSAQRRRRRRARPAPARAESGNTRCIGMSERARGLALLLDLRLDLRRRRQRVDAARRSCSARRSASSACRAEVLAPDRQVGLRHAGVGAEDEHRRVRASAAGPASARARRRSRSGPACRGPPGPA